MRFLAATVLLLAAVVARAERILLIPLDSRPAAGQFAQMISNMADVQVTMPPYDLLGRYIQPGNPEGILRWLEEQDMSDVSNVVISADMICYGGLIASRTNDTPQEIAFNRLQRLVKIRQANPKTRFYVFAAVMRLAPTATRATAAWRLQLARYAELKDRYARLKDPANKKSIDNLLARIPAYELQKYEEARNRNLEVSRELIKMAARNHLDYLLFGQDDAKQYGMHVPETERLKKLTSNLYVAGKVYFSEGIDQLANLLVSRALLKQNSLMPRIRVVYSDELGRKKYGNYESKPVESSLRDQILASGATLAEGNEEYDYSLYVNTPDRRDQTFGPWIESLKSEVDQGFPVSVADINIGKDGTSDPVLFEALMEGDRMVKLLSFAGWNTAGNTMGTSIPAANVYLLARRLRVDPLKRELAQREFLLHRYVNDYAYHKFTRKEAYGLIDSMARASREETYGLEFDEVNSLVQRNLGDHLNTYFKERFLGKRFFAGTQQYLISDLTEVKIFLPWPRAYEVRLEFKLQAKPVVDGDK